jgi:hypothetical protein
MSPLRFGLEGLLVERVGCRKAFSLLCSGMAVFKRWSLWALGICLFFSSFLSGILLCAGVFEFRTRISLWLGLGAGVCILYDELYNCSLLIGNYFGYT